MDDHGPLVLRIGLSVVLITIGLAFPQLVFSFRDPWLMFVLWSAGCGFVGAGLGLMVKHPWLGAIAGVVLAVPAFFVLSFLTWHGPA